MNKLFYDQGYIIIKNLYSLDEINLMKDAFIRIQDTSKLFNDSSEILNSKFIIENKILKRVIWAGGIEPILLALSHKKELLTVISELLETNEFIQILNQCHFKTPNDGVGFKAHQDIQNRDKKDGTWIDIDGRGSFIQSMIAIDKITNDNGPLWIIPNSHKQGSLSEEEIQKMVDINQKLVITMNEGDVAFWSPYLIHGSEPNTSIQSRNTLINGFCLTGANNRIYSGCGTGIRIKI